MGEDRMKTPRLFHGRWNKPYNGKERDDWDRNYDYVARTFSSSNIPTWHTKLTKQGWHDAWIDMVTLCSRALEYKDEAERRAKHLEDELQTTNKKIIESSDSIEKMVKSFDELGEKYTKDIDALMKLLILLGRKIDE
mgnify:CR=1 FL=1